MDIVPAGTYDTGLDDLNASDLIVPRLRIKHKLGVFENDATSEQFGEVFAVLLGLVRQRALFHHVVEENDVPMCKSPDYQSGYPNLDPPRKDAHFPWALAQMDPNDYPPDEEGVVTVACQNCRLKEWGTHPVTAKAPYCAEQHTLPLYYADSADALLAGDFTPALLTVQKTGIAPSKRYLGIFKAKNVGAYTAITRITLSQQKRGQNDYCVPIFQTVGKTPEANWPEYSTQYAGIRMFLTEARPRVAANADVAQTTTQPATTSQSAPIQANTPAQATVPPRPPIQPQPAPASQTNVPPVIIDPDSDELPF